MSSTDPPEDLGFELPPPAQRSRIGVIVAVTVVIGVAFAIGYLRRSNAHGELAVFAGAETKPVRVEVAKPKLLTSDRALALPGTVRALEETQIYSRVTGYVRAWKVDIGDKVTAGQLLVELETPELDAQLAQARAQLAQARAAVRQASAQRDYSKSNTARYQTLADQKLISKSQVEQTEAQAATDEATVSAAQSNVSAMEANVRRLADTQSFQKVTAPFAGTITTRNVDRGALVRDGATTPMFTLVATDPVRILVDVPQSVAPSVKPDTAATVSVREYGSRTFEGKVARSAGALDLELHTMTTEVRVPNPDGALMPGMYVQVAITLPVPHRVLEIPATALYSDAHGLRVAVVDKGRRVKLVPITIERDTGATLIVATGLTGDEQIIKIAVPTILDGDLVELGAP
jgi:membrane fusion protein, multidrug efflux system